MRIYLQQDGKPAGPYDEATMRSYLAQGTVAPGTYAWVEGMSEWRPVGELLGTPASPAGAPGGFLPPQTAADPVAPVAGPYVVQKPRTSWFARLLMGCGVLAIVVIVVAAAVAGYIVYQDHLHHGSSGSADWAKFDRDMEESRQSEAKEWTDLQAEIARDAADTEHYTTIQTNNPGGGTTRTITPKSNTPGGKQITIQVDADGKTTTKTRAADGTTMVRTEDRNGNTTSTTSRP